jgi:hypothetical protein
MNWKLRNPVEVMTGARDVRINLDRKGRFKPLGDDAGSDLRALVAAVAAVALAAQVDEYGEIECDALSAKYAVFVIMLSPTSFGMSGVARHLGAGLSGAVLAGAPRGGPTSLGTSTSA